jgi:hypothetical protein
VLELDRKLERRAIEAHVGGFRRAVGLYVLQMAAASA